MRSEKINDYTRRDFLRFAAVGAGALNFPGLLFGRSPNGKNLKETLIYIGTYTSGKSKSEGIYVYKLDLVSGSLQPYKIVKNVVEPSYLAIDKTRKYLYAVNETETYENKKSGALSAFAIEPGGKFLLAANQNSDSIVVFRIDGKTGKLAQVGKPVFAPTPVCLKMIPMFS